MRILLWSETFYPRIGGVEVMGAEFVRALHDRGHEVMIIAGPYEEGISDPQLFHDLPLYRFPFEYEVHPYNMAMVIRIKQQLAALRQEFRPDVFHLYQTRQSFFFHIANQKQGDVPTVLTLHGAFFDGTPQVNQARRQLCQQVDWTVACSHTTLNETHAVVPEITGKSSVIYNALAMPTLEPTPLDFDEPRILYVGRLHPQKRVEVAIDAFARVQSRFPRARLLVAGNGVEEPALRNQVERLGLQGVVDFLGWVAPQAVPALINQATVMLVPSRLEPFGLVALQGAQMARPVIAARVGGLPEVVADGETGLLVDGEDADVLADSMADTLATLLTQPDRARTLGAAARVRGQQLFGWTTFLGRYEALYAQVVEQAAKQRA